MEEANKCLKVGEILISLNICSVFPSVPIPQTKESVGDLLQNNSVNEDKIDDYLSFSYFLYVWNKNVSKLWEVLRKEKDSDG